MSKDNIVQLVLDSGVQIFLKLPKFENLAYVHTDYKTITSNSCNKNNSRLKIHINV